ncbi:MAG: sulfurtransferase [Candidatus Dormibacteraeota bacterium]|nr:sulfurtransferase [Candidatus Dormibacteraeota bacterium]
MPETSPPLVQPGHLIRQLGSPDLVVLDVRWSLERGAERQAHLAGHIPGAEFVDLDLELAGPAGARGRHPLPPVESFAASMRRHGVRASSRVVVYDEVTGAAARAWWMLRAAGHPRVAVLDGSLQAYLEAGGRLTRELPEPRSGDFQATGFEGWVGADGLETCRGRGTLVVDARARARYLGQPNPLDPRPGHLPGAVSLPWTELFERGRLRPRAQLLRLLGESGAGESPVVVYCGSGVTSCAVLLALEVAGIGPGRLYPGSWSEWAADPGRPVQNPMGA